VVLKNGGTKTHFFPIDGYFSQIHWTMCQLVSKLSTFEAPLVGLKTSTTGEPGAPPAANFVNNHGMPFRNTAFHNESKTNESSIKRHSLAFST